MADSNLYGIPFVQVNLDATSQLYAVTGSSGNYTDTRLPVAVILNNTVLTGTPTVPGYLTSAIAASTYLTQTNAASTYLTQTNATSTYLSITTAASTYLTITNAASTYLTQANAATTYGAKASPLSQFASTTSAQLAGVISDETGSGSAVFGTAPTLNQPNVVGTTTNNNAAAGSVGEIVTNGATGVSLTTGTNANLVTISLSAGDWDVSGVATLVPAGTTTTSDMQAVGISTTSATFGTANTGTATSLQGATNAGRQQIFPTPVVRVSISTTTTVYLVFQSIFAVSTATANGFIRARRVR